MEEEADAAGTSDRELVLGWVFGVLAAVVALAVAGSREDVSLSTTDLWREVAAAVLLDAMDYAMGQAGAQEARCDSDDFVATAGGRWPVVLMVEEGRVAVVCNRGGQSDGTDRQEEALEREACYVASGHLDDSSTGLCSS